MSPRSLTTSAAALGLGPLPRQFEALTVAEIRALPKPALQELSVLLAEMDRSVTTARDHLTQALTELYGEQVRSQLQGAGRDTGTAHVTDGDLVITAEIKKNVAWDQAKLADIARRIAEGGDDPAEYIDVKYSVSERKYEAWPETIKTPFAAARTLKPAKPTYRLALLGEKA